MSSADSRRIAALEAQVRRQAAEVGQLREANHRLTHELAVARHERDEARAHEAARTHELATTRAELATTQAKLDQTRQQHADTKRQLAELVHALNHSDERLRALVRREFGASSERSCSDQTYVPEILAALREQEAVVALTPDTAAAADTPEQAVTVMAAGDQAATTPPTQPQDHRGRRRPANAGGRKPLPEDIERRHRDYVPPADHPALRNALRHDTIGTTILERWHIGKLDLHIECLHCPVVKLTLPGDIVSQQTLSPPAVIERGQVSDTLLVQSAVERVIDHLPAYRQEQRALRVGVHIPRAKLCRWHIALAGFLTGVADALFDEIVACEVIGIDDSVHRLLVEDRPRCQQARIWAVTSPAGTFYQFSTTREGRWISELLEDYHGAVMGDAYAGHKALLSRDDIIALFCWAHVRRKFYDSADTARRGIMLGMIGELYAVEGEIATASPTQKVFVRSAKAKPVLERIKTQLDTWRTDPQVLPRSGIGKAVSYALKLWPGLERYLTIGTAPIDNNHTERSMRSAAMQRKNSLFSASVAGAEAYATLLTLARSAVDLGLDPVAYLCDIIEDIHFARRPLRDLTPQAYARRAPSQCEGRS